jgi:Mg-chelatase subunit ChlD
VDKVIAVHTQQKPISLNGSSILNFLGYLLSSAMRSIALLLLVSNMAFGQITSTQQKALNSYVDYANISADEMTSVVKSIIDYYPKLHQKTSWGPPRYVCPVQLEEYYAGQVVLLSKTLNATTSTALNLKFKELKSAAEKVDERCKALDTYHKLEDYKQDNFAKALVMVNEMQVLLADYKKKQTALRLEIESVSKKMTAAIPQNAYRKASDVMLQQVTREREFLDSWNFNVNENVHTGWPVDKLEKNITETADQLEVFKKTKPPLQYPASSMWGSFQENLGTILEIKRSGLNGYNFEAKKSDKHSNDVYLSLINYFNGTLVSDYNAFIGFSERDSYYGLKTIKYVPGFEIRSQAKIIEVAVKPFEDVQRTPVTIAPQKIALQKTVFESLSTYVRFINETWRQTRNLQSIISNLSSSAAYYKNIDSFERHGGMSFDYKNYEVPLAEHQIAISSSKVLPPSIAKTLNDQATVILNILKELDDISASLEIEIKERRYEKDRLTKVYEMLERQKVLFELWDERKEWLYSDLRKVYDAYPVTNASNSWQVSGAVLRQLTDLDRDALFKAKAYYKGDSSITITTDQIDQTLRDIIAKEYSNMKGIEKIGRNNGNCPYTPYEDLPETSKSLSDALKKLKPVRSTQRYEHPYYRLVYHYNDIVDDYNKFSELSKDVFHLPTVHQPEFFVLTYPGPKKNDPVVVAKNDSKVPESRPKEVVKEEKRNPAAEVKPVVAPVSEKIKVQHDTIYIEKRDTVYLSEPGENLRSMEGYASNNMVLLLDVSGSMNDADKLPLLKQSVLNMLSMMRPEDKVSIIAFSGKPRVLLEGTSFQDEKKIQKAINDLKSSGKTDGNAGLKLAYKVADGNYIRGGNNRIILATDGQFATSEETLGLISTFSGQDIFLTIFNFGKGAGSSKELQKLALQGKGNYEFISRENVELKLIREAKAKKKK